MNKTKVFITGENGFIAKNLAKLFAASDEYILCNGKDSPFVDFREGEVDIRDYDALLNVKAKTLGVDLIIHTAAIVGTDYCLDEPNESINTNVQGTLNVVNFAKHCDAKLVYFSTTASYDPDTYDGYEISENTIRNPKTLYGITKYAGELICSNLYDKEKTLIIRPCFAYGGEGDLHSALSKLIKNGVKRNNGEEVEELQILLDPNNKKDYMHVSDLCDGVFELIRNEFAGDFNISLGHAVKFSDIIRELSEQNLFPNFRLYPEQDYLKNHIVSNKKIASHTFWRPKISLRDGIAMVKKQIEESLDA